MESVDKANPENMWAQENSKTVQSALKAYMETNPGVLALAARRSVTCALFRKLSPQEQSAWKSKSQAAKMHKKVAGPLAGTDRDSCVTLFQKLRSC